MDPVHDATLRIPDVLAAELDAIAAAEWLDAARSFATVPEPLTIT